MGTKMCKPGQVPVDVADDAVEAFKSSGYSVVDGEVDPTADSDNGGSGLTQAEIDAELGAIEKLTRKKGEDAGLDDDEIEADIAKAVSEAKQKMGVE